MSLTTHIHSLSHNIASHLSAAIRGQRDIDTHILFMPQPLWKGDAGQARWLINGHLSCNGQHIKFADSPWQDDTVMRHAFWGPYARSFTFMTDIRALGGDAGRYAARQLVKDWINTQDKSAIKALAPAETAQRISAWLTHFDFYGQTAPDHFIHLVTQSIARQLRALSTYPAKHIPACQAIHVAKALIFCGTCMSNQDKAYDDGMDMLRQILQEQILPDGGHISRSPAILVDYLQACLEIHALLQRHSKTDHAPILLSTIERMSQAMRFFTMPDGHTPLMHGGTLTLSEQIAAMSRMLNLTKTRRPWNLADSGFYALRSGRITAMIDTGSVPGFKYNDHCHAGLASFELYYGREKLITNCGAHPIAADWRHMLKSTAAHSTLILDDRNACEILPDGHIGRMPAAPKAQHIILDDKSQLVELSHDGYMAALNTRHTRRIHCSADGQTIIGQDILISEITRGAPLEFSIRFHLSPMVKASVIKGGQEILLRLPSGKGCSFSGQGAKMRLEDSIVIGKDLNPRKTQQIVLEGRFSGGLEESCWSFRFND